MQSKQNIISLSVTLFILFIFFIGLTNVLINSYVSGPAALKEHPEDIVAIPSEPLKTPMEKSTRNILVPEQPARYDIEVLPDAEMSLNQTYWDAAVRNVLLHSKATTPATRGERRSNDLNERLGQISKQIKSLEKNDKKSPNDQAEKIKLQSLYILRSSLTALGEMSGDRTPKKK